MCLLHTRIQEFSPRGEGGGRVQAEKSSIAWKKLWQVIFFGFSPNLQLLNSFTEGAGGGGGGSDFFLFDLILFVPSTIFQLYSSTKLR